MQHERPVLILSENLDYHGIAIKWGLSEKGVPHTWWKRSSFPAIEFQDSSTGRCAACRIHD